MSDGPPTAPVAESNGPDDRDLGFGSVVARESRQRFLNRDGSFNVGRDGLSFWTSLSLYHTLLRLTWPRFLAMVVVAYVAINLLFAAGFLLCGPAALTGLAPMHPAARYLQLFFFSVQTVSTIGYGQVAPVSMAANTLVAVESVVGLLGFALAAGLVFARFSQPAARILFSRHAIIAPYRGRTALEMRITNARRNQIIELRARIIYTHAGLRGDVVTRHFDELPLERHQVAFFPLSWTLVHPIDEDSPLHGMGPADLLARDAEFLVLLTGIDEQSSQTVHTRSSYKAEEVLWNVKFVDIFNRGRLGDRLSIDVGRLSDVEVLQ